MLQESVHGCWVSTLLLVTGVMLLMHLQLPGDKAPGVARQLQAAGAPGPIHDAGAAAGTVQCCIHCLSAGMVETVDATWIV